MESQIGQLRPEMAHLLRRAGFGLAAEERAYWSALSLDDAIDRLVDFEASPGDVDARVGTPGLLNIVSSEAYDPIGNLVDALQRWVFRMVHTKRPLQEKMTLFWHNHFATGRSKVMEKLSFPGATRAFATTPAEDPDGAMGQIELFRTHALGNFRDLLLGISRDPAMIAWLDGDTNIVGKPQENFARELMELFTFGIGHFTEEDVYAGARVFTGWNLQPIEIGAEDVHYRGFRYAPEMHDTGFKTFSFPIYADGTTTIPARDADEGAQDGVDLIHALARHPATARFLARKLIAFFVNERDEPPPALVDHLAGVYLDSDCDMRAVMRALFRSAQFQDPANHWARYAWPAEFVARAIKEIGGSAANADNAVFGMISMGQALYDPPDVSGWRLGRSWISTSTMLARMNFAMNLCWSQKDVLQDAARAASSSPEALLAHMLDIMTCKPFDAPRRQALRAYLEGAATPDEISARAAGLAHLIAASGEYQFI